MGLVRHSALILLAASVGALAQQQKAQEQDPVFRVDVRLVRLLATVKDNYGKPVGGLTKEDFVVSENGVKQEIAVFDRYNAQPLSVGILLDISGSTAGEMKYQTDAVSRFVRALFGEGNPDDRAALYAFNWQTTLAVPYTNSAVRFAEAMRKLKAEAGTSLYDSILLASEDVEERDGRHVLIVVTDGGDTVSSTGFQRALQAAHKADAVIYPVLTVPISNDAGRNVGGENALTMMAQTTGGRMFTPGASGLDQAFSEILRDLRTQYLIGYYPRAVPPTKDPFRRISIKPMREGLHVVSRTGYYAEAGAGQ